MYTTRVVRMSFVFLALAVTARAGWLDGWQQRRSITVNPSQVEADLTNFPVLVRLTAGQFDFALAAADGRDVRFTDSDGTTALDFERDSHDASARTATYWVRLPLLSPASNTTFYLYYGNTGATDGATPAAVWDNAHVGVWHLQGTNGVLQADSTAGANHVAVYPIALDAGDVAISDCDSLTDWTGTDLSLDGTNKDLNAASVYAIKETVAAVVVGQTNTIVYKPAAPLALGQRRLDFYLRCTKKRDDFTQVRVYLYDTVGNYRYHDCGTWTETLWRYMGFGINEGGKTGGTAPDMNAIDRIEWVFVKGDDKPYDVQIDTVYANGALEEGEPGVVGDGVRLSGYDHYLITTQEQSIDTIDGLTYSAWVRPKNYDVSQRDGYTGYIVTCGGGNWNPYWLSALSYYKQNYIYGYSANGSYEETPRTIISKNATGLSTGVWSHVAASYVYDPVTSNTTMMCFVNGIKLIDTFVTNRAIKAVMDRPIFFGAIKWAQEGDQDFIRCFFAGDMDEVRVSRVRRSAAWIKASFLSQKAGSSFVSLGNAESTAAWLGGWKYRRAIIINSADIDADLTNFPVLVRLSAGYFDFNWAAADGRDVRFTDASGGAVLDFERESHDASAGTAAYWVRLPLVSAASNTTFYLYHGNSRAQDMATPAAVWDNAHVGVWHLGGTNGVTQADATQAANSLTVGPAALAESDVVISDCDSLTDWTGTSLSLDGTNKDPNNGSVNAIKNTVASNAAGQTNMIVYNPAAPISLGQRRLDFFLQCSTSNTAFSTTRVYIYDTAGNYRYHDFGAWNATQWRYMGFGIGTEGTTGGTAPDVNAIDRIEWVFVSKTAAAYTMQIDSLYANGALEEGMAGVIGDGVRLSGYDHYLVTKNQNFSTANGLTFSAWVRPHRYAVQSPADSLKSFVVSIGGGNWPPYWYSALGYYSQEKIFIYSWDAKTATSAPNTAGFSTGVWSHVAATYRFDPVASNTTVACYINGVKKIDNTVVGTALQATMMNKPIYLGVIQWASAEPDKVRGFLNGDMDEVRVSNALRTAAWIKASYRNQVPGSALLSFGGLEPPRGSAILLK